MPPFPSRLAYAVEFLLALLVIFMLWDQVGGQEHLDLMPWYAKLFLPLSLAWVTVAGTASAAGREKIWNKVTLICVVLALLLALSMGLLTYYFHLHEDDDADDGRSGDSAFSLSAPGGQV